MGTSNRQTEGIAPEPLARKQCPYCGFNNEYRPSTGPPAQCDTCERKFATPMEARAAYDAMFGHGFWFHARRYAEGLFAGRRARLVLLGVALGTALGEIGRRLWAE